MDQRLEDRLDKWYKQVEKIKPVEEILFNLEANRDAIEGNAFRKAEGKTVQDRLAEASCSESVQNIKLGIAESKSMYNHEKRILELKIKAYEAEYLTLKLEFDAIKAKSS